MADNRGYRDNPEERSLVELLSEGKRDKKGLKQGIKVMMEKREQQKEREHVLLQKIEHLKHTLDSLQSDKGSSVADLKDEIEVLKALKHNPFVDDSKEFKRDELFPRENNRRRKKGGTRIQRTASVSSVPVYDRQMYKRESTARTLYEDYDDQNSKRPASSRAVRHYERRKKPEVRNRRRSAPSPHAAINVSGNKVEDAVQAFLDIFSNLRPKEMKSIWKKSRQTEERGNVKLLHMNRLGPLLHELVVIAFMRDNPDRPAPGPHRTKPLVELLTLRLLPYIQNKKYLDIEHFKMFPIWLEKRGKPLMANQGSRDEIPADDKDQRKHLTIGSKCFIWSVGGQVWHKGEVVKIKHDAQGEWMVVRYFNNHTWLEKEVQRYSQSLRFPKNNLKKDIVV